MREEELELGSEDQPDLTPFNQLRDFLKSLPPGPIEDEDGVLSGLLENAWYLLSGGRNQKTDGRKVADRMEDPHWDPPHLTFTVERHGAMARGSNSASLHDWCIDIDRRSADVSTDRKRRLVPNAPALKVEPIALSVADAIVSGTMDDPRLKWKSKDQVTVRAGKCVPGEGVFNQTLLGRRKRFRKALREMMQARGWDLSWQYNFTRRVAEVAVPTPNNDIRGGQ